MTELKLAISPCPNDTFMFDALINGRIDTEGLTFETRFADIEQLNEGVHSGRVHVSKVSCAVLPRIADRYRVLECGSALGRGNGPVLVMRPGTDLTREGLRVAVPGVNTTANLLLQRLFPQFTDRTPVLFSDIARRICSGEFDAGVLIHEGRFTYARHGLELVADLGAVWEERTGLPLPLGCIVISRDLPDSMARCVNGLLRRSILHARRLPADSAAFIKSHAQELDEAVLQSHIDTFVNDFSLGLGQQGRGALRLLTGLSLPDCDFVG